MQILDCLPKMTKSYLSRIVDSVFQEDIPKGSEEQLREKIEQNLDHLTNNERIAKALDFVDMARTCRILSQAIIISLLERSGYYASEEILFNDVQKYEKYIISKSKDPEAFNYSNPDSIEIYKTILEVAFEDSDISKDEFALLEKLRHKLKINRLEHQLLESQLGMFPQPGNSVHTFDDFRQAHVELQRRGILFFCNHADPEPVIALPDEIAQPVASVLGFEMRKEAQLMLYDTINLGQLKSAAKQQGLPVSGTKQAIIERFIETLCKPSEILNTLSNDDLTEICRKLPGVKVSGSKQQKMQYILDYYASLTFKPAVPSEDPRGVYYQYLEELAARNNKELYRLKIISRDRDMEHYFEDGTRYMFEHKLGLKLKPFEGNEHADGCVEFNNGELLLWDNKGKEQKYSFPKSHADQFLKYIRESVKRVNVFLVIVPEIAKEAEHQAMQLRYRNTTDTDIALISAQNLKYVAENWKSFSKNGEFDLNVFNTTGILDRPLLEERMKILLS